ncbi:MAG: hypothetical protein AB7G75_17000 [Candidatus Binatia bacterium]
MDGYNHIYELWTQHDYMGALSVAWQLPATDNYPYLRSVVRLPDFTLSELVLRACRQAAARSLPARPNQTHHDQAVRWVEHLLHNFSPPAVLVDHSDGDEAEAFRSHMLQAHLRCVSIALQIQQEEDASDTRADSNAAFEARLFDYVSHQCRHIDQETDLPLPFFRDLLYSLLPAGAGPHQLIQPDISVSLTALLVGKKQRQGVVATLSLEQRSSGSGLCYPAPDLAFVRRDPTFREAEYSACKYVKDAGLWKADQDARWRIERRDGQPINTLTGSSMGFAFALGLAKLFSLEQSR